jgi:hypothetical protein
MKQAIFVNFYLKIFLVTIIMTNYTCERCRYSTHLRADFKKHLQKQNECPSTYSSVDPQTLLENLLKPKPYPCSHCGKSFGYAQNLSRHEKSEHSSIFINNSQADHSQNSHNTETHTQSHNNTSNSHNHSNNTTTTNTNSNNTVNINLNVFGKEELSHILGDEEFLTQCVRNITGKGLQQIVNSIWCNKDVPENHNVELKRERKPRLVNIYVQDEKGERWVEKLADEVIDDMIRKGTGILQVHNNKLYKFDEDMTESDTERHDIRSNAISKLMRKSRGYGKKRDSIVVELRNLKAEKQ